MWNKIKSIFSSVSTITSGTNKIWGAITLVLALYGGFSTLLVRWYGSEYKVSQDRLQEVSVSLSEVRLEHSKYTQQVTQSLEAIAEGEDKKTDQLKEATKYEIKKRSTVPVLTDDDVDFYGELSKSTNEAILKSHHNTRGSD